MAKCAPLLISVYNRFEHLKRCIEALKRNRLAPETDLYVVSDAAYREEDRQVIAEIRNYLKELVGFKTIICLFWDVNKGSHASTMDAIKVLFEKYDCFIRVEDDIIVSTDFLDYMNAGLSYYKDDPNVYAICGYKAPFCIPKNYEFDVWFYPAFSPWGYAVWKHKFNEIDRSDWDRYSELKKDKSPYLNYQGTYSSEKISSIIKGKYGLIWDGEKSNTCTGLVGNYLKYNNPHKLSMYLVANIPIIIWDQAAEAQFVKKNNVGITISSIDEIPNKLSSIDAKKYDKMLDSVKLIKNKLLQGKYLNTQLDNIESKIINKKNENK